MSTMWTPRTKPGLPLKRNCQRAGDTMLGKWPGGPLYQTSAVCQPTEYYSWICIKKDGITLHVCFHSCCSAPFYKIMVPTVDTVRYNFLAKALVMSRYPVLLTGPVGTGKTSVAQSILHGLDNKWSSLTVNMSSQVSASALPVCVSVLFPILLTLSKTQVYLQRNVLFLGDNTFGFLSFLESNPCFCFSHEKMWSFYPNMHLYVYVYSPLTCSMRHSHIEVFEYRGACANVCVSEWKCLHPTTSWLWIASISASLQLESVDDVIAE